MRSRSLRPKPPGATLLWVTAVRLAVTIGSRQGVNQADDRAAPVLAMTPCAEIFSKDADSAASPGPSLAGFTPRDGHATGASPVMHCELRSQVSSSQGFSSLDQRQASTRRVSCFVSPLHPLQNLPKPYAHTFRVPAAALSQMVRSAFPSL
jgi:hypothetical protein